MSTITTQVMKLTPKERKLYRAGLINVDGTLNGQGRDAILDIIYRSKQDELVQLVDEIRAEEAAEGTLSDDEDDE